MKKLLTVLITFSFTTAYALTGSFFQDDREYGLTDEFYSVSEIDNLNSSLPEGCELLSCDEALILKEKLNYSADYFFCDKGVIDNYGNSTCSIVDISGKKYVECNGNFLDKTSFRAFVSCPIFPGKNTTAENETSAYLNFTPQKETYYCVKDMNGNGFFDEEGEIQQCIEADGGKGYVCPIDKVSCEATYEKPLCPEGILNPERDMCQANAIIKCPSGYKWDSSLDKCVLTPPCPDGGVLNTVRDRCEKMVVNRCPAGYTYDSINDTCVKKVDCEDGVLVPERNRCEKSVIWECPIGYTLSNGKCISNPTCPTGTTYNLTYNKCITSFTPNCPLGYIYNSLAKRCETSPICPKGFTYNSATNRCETRANVSYTCSSNSQNYSTLSACQSNCKIEGKCSARYEYEYVKNYTQNPFMHDVYYRNPNIPLPADLSTIPNGAPPKGGKLVLLECNPYFCIFVYAALKTNYLCSINGQLYSDISNCQANCVSTGTCSQVGSCPSGSTLSGSFCLANPSCPSGGTFDGNADVCWTDYIPFCPTGTTYDSVLNACVANPTCYDGGVLNTSTDRCELSPTADCGSWTYDSNLNVCYSSPVCPGGIYNSNLKECVTTVTRDCGTYLWDSSNSVCYYPVNCPKDSAFSLNNTINYSSTLDRCVSDAEHICPSGDTYVYTWNKEVRKCELVPMCAEGVYNPDADGCYVGDITCPVGDYPCLPIDGKNYCSPNPCQQWSSALEYDDTQEGATDKQADGQIDENGNCLGTIYIFNGNDYRCRPPGLQTGGSDCCKKTTTWFGLGQCNEREKILAKLRSWGKLDGQCHYVGSYCAVKVFKLCIQKKKTYCCFHSVLARIIQEQGRQQLGIDWGSPKSPNCRGFTPEEFQRIDFSKIDFSEWYEDLQKRIKENLNVFKNEMPKKIQNYYEKLQKH